MVKSPLPNFLATAASIGSLKNIQTCAPCPERERSIYAGLLFLIQVVLNASRCFLKLEPSMIVKRYYLTFITVMSLSYNTLFSFLSGL